MLTKPTKKRVIFDFFLMGVLIICIIPVVPKLYGKFNAQNWYFRGKSLAADKNYSKALYFLEKAAKAKPDVGKIHLMIGVVHLDRGETKLAEEAFLRALDNFLEQENRARTHYNLGVLYLKNLDQPEKAIHHFEEALKSGAKRYSDGIDIYQILSFLYLDSAQPEKAVAIAEEALRVRPRTPQRLFDTAMVYYTAGRFKDAYETTKKVLEVDPSHSDAQSFQKSLEDMSEQRYHGKFPEQVHPPFTDPKNYAVHTYYNETAEIEKGTGILSESGERDQILIDSATLSFPRPTGWEADANVSVSRSTQIIIQYRYPAASQPQPGIYITAQKQDEGANTALEFAIRNEYLTELKVSGLTVSFPLEVRFNGHKFVYSEMTFPAKMQSAKIGVFDTLLNGNIVSFQLMSQADTFDENLKVLQKLVSGIEMDGKGQDQPRGQQTADPWAIPGLEEQLTKIRDNPGDFRNYLTVANLYAGKGRGILASQYAEKALALNPDDPAKKNIYDTLAMAYYSCGNIKKSYEAAQMASKMAPDDEEAQAMVKMLENVSKEWFNGKMPVNAQYSGFPEAYEASRALEQRGIGEVGGSASEDDFVTFPQFILYVTPPADWHKDVNVAFSQHTGAVLMYQKNKELLTPSIAVTIDTPQEGMKSAIEFSRWVKGMMEAKMPGIIVSEPVEKNVKGYQASFLTTNVKNDPKHMAWYQFLINDKIITFQYVNDADGFDNDFPVFLAVVESLRVKDSPVASE